MVLLACRMAARAIQTISLVTGRADQVIPQFLAALADPAVLAGRIAVDEGMVRYVACDHGARPYKGIAPDGRPADDCTVRPQTGPFFDQGRPGFVHAPDMGARIENVCEDHARATKNVIFQGNSLVDADIVLHLAAVAYNCIGANDDILSDIAVFSDDGTGHHMAEMPDLCSVADADPVVDPGGLVGKPGRIAHARASLRAVATCCTCPSSR